MPIRIAFVNGKGGVGKTTCATLVAAALSSARQSVSIDDRDPQKTSTTAAENILKLPVGETGEVIIIDTAPNLESEGTLDAIRTADLVILVTTPRPSDLATTAVTARLIQHLRTAPTRVLFNYVQTNNRFFKTMPKIAEQLPFPKLKAFLTQLTAYQVTSLAGWAALPKDLREEVIKVAVEIAREFPVPADNRTI